MPGATIELQGVSRRFHLGADDVWAVRDVTMSVPAGQFLALIGRSGSGKTTLLNLIAGLDRPTEGTVEIDGQRVDNANERQLTRLRRHTIGFIFQSFGLLPLLSAQENVELPLRIAGYGHGDRVRRARRVLDMVGLGRRAEHRPYELSGGEQQRVAIARAMAIEPALLLADEPTGELDSATATAIFTLLRDVARAEGVTIVTCTHDPLVMELAERVEELADGRLVTGEGHVRAHVRQRAASAFRAPTAVGAQPALSSLIGGDVARLGRGALPEEPVAAPAPDGGPSVSEPSGEAPTDHEPDDDEVSRWGRPGS